MENKELITNNIAFLKDYLPKLINAIEEVVEYLITNNETDAFNLITDIIEGMEWTMRSIHSLQNLNYIEDITPNEVNKILEEITQAFQKKDLVLLSDLFQYELIEILLAWNEKLDMINGEIN